MRKLQDITLEKEVPEKFKDLDFGMDQVVNASFGPITKKGVIVNIYRDKEITSFLIDFGKNCGNMWCAPLQLSKV